MLTVNVARRPARVKPAAPMTYEQFLEWTDAHTYAEWVDGKIEFMSPVTLPHSRIGVFLSRLFAEYAEQHDAGALLTAPFQMKLSKVKRGREPDLMFVAKADAARLTNTFLDGPATLAVEIVSPESRERDRKTKYSEYEREGVKEYWVIDPEQQQADFYVLNGAGKYEAHAPDESGIYHSVVLPGFWINTHWLWQSPPPTMRLVRAEWGIA